MRRARQALEEFWRGPGGGGEVLALAYPLILSNISYTLETFLDRVFLSHYSKEAMAGAHAGMFVLWVFIGLFVYTGEYLTTFVAQYHGARRPERIGPALWQGLYFSLIAGVLVASLSPFAEPVFARAGHAPAVQEAEVRYTRIMMLGAFPAIAMATLSTFFSGRGATRTVLLVNLFSAVLDTVLNWCWIFGHLGFPRAGVAGAAYSTIVSQAAGALAYVVLILRPEQRRAYATLAGWRLEPRLLGRLVRYGLPSGLTVSLEVLAFALFMILVGRLGTDGLAATTIAFTLNALIFMPMLGLGIGVSSLVGRYLGAERPELAERSTWSAFWMSLAYMGGCGIVFVLAPGPLLAPFGGPDAAATFAGVSAVATVLLRFVVVYSIFDMMNVVFAAGLKGAGDTAYPLALTVGLSWGAMLVPGYVACLVLGGGVYTAWCFASAYVVLLGLLMQRRFRAGRWKALRVIEPHVPELDAELAAPPEAEPA
jgi:MATE family multidrug resistance protein